MNEAELEKLKFPIGKFNIEGDISLEAREQFILDIEAAPFNLRKAVEGLSQSQLDTPYRPDGWTIRQVLHHLPDSHMNSYIRFKLALTENAPAIKPYEEARWAELKGSYETPIEVSLDLFESLHKRWAVLLRAMTEEDFSKSYNHPESGLVKLDKALAIYAWHGRHHTAHITSLRQRSGWL